MQSDCWDALFLKGARIGYGHTLVRKVERNGRKLVETDALSHLQLTRFGQPVEQDLKLATLETPEGQLLEFRTEVAMGPGPVVTTGHVDGDLLLIDIDDQGQRVRSAVPWSDSLRGFLGVEQSLAGQPLEPGQKRALRMLMPLLNDVADVELAAGDYESTPVMGRPKKLLRIESVARLSDGNVMAETLWVDEQGEILKRRIAGLDQESHRTTEALAKAQAGATAPTIDIGADTIVPVAQPLAGAHQANELHYQVELAEGDPAKIFASGPTQSVRSTGPHTAEITVRALSPAAAASSTPAAARPDERYTAANSVLQVADPEIQKMAAAARGAETDPVKIALALEKYVHDALSINDFTQAFSSAAEVAKSRTGDCTEHAVLLAALARAAGIPSRVAIGLVYVERAHGFGYHMWTEVYLNGQWVPLDATLGQGGIGAAHLKLVDSSLDGTTAYSAFLPVAQVVGQLQIKALDAPGK
ncbi:MAG: transglutaminase family protein [Pirellulales bacterium]